jgi:hypothetical protein
MVGQLMIVDLREKAKPALGVRGSVRRDVQPGKSQMT